MDDIRVPKRIAQYLADTFALDGVILIGLKEGELAFYFSGANTEEAVYQLESLLKAVTAVVPRAPDPEVDMSLSGLQAAALIRQRFN